MSWNILTTEEFNSWMLSLPAKAQQKILTALSWLEAEVPARWAPPGRYY